MAGWLSVGLVIAFFAVGIAARFYFLWARSLMRFRSPMRDRRQALSPSHRALIALRSVDPCRVGLVEADRVYAAAAEAIGSGLPAGTDASTAEEVVRRALHDARCERPPSRSAVRRIARLCLSAD